LIEERVRWEMGDTNWEAQHVVLWCRLRLWEPANNHHSLDGEAI